MLVAAPGPAGYYRELLMCQLRTLALGTDAMRSNAQAGAHGGNEPAPRVYFADVARHLEGRSALDGCPDFALQA